METSLAHSTVGTEFTFPSTVTHPVTEIYVSYMDIYRLLHKLSFNMKVY